MKRASPIDATTPPAKRLQEDNDVEVVFQESIFVEPNVRVGEFSEKTTVEDVVRVIAALPYSYQKQVIEKLTPLGLFYLSRYPQLFDATALAKVGKRIENLQPMEFPLDANKHCFDFRPPLCRCGKECHREQEFEAKRALSQTIENIYECHERQWKSFKNDNNLKLGRARYVKPQDFLKVYAKKMLEENFTGPDAFMDYQLDRISPMLETRHYNRFYNKRFQKEYYSAFPTCRNGQPVFGCDSTSMERYPILDKPEGSCDMLINNLEAVRLLGV